MNVVNDQEILRSLWSVFFPKFHSEIVVRPNFEIHKMSYTGTVNVLGYPHSSSGTLGKLVVHFHSESGDFESIYVYEGSFEYGCFTGPRCTVCVFKDITMPQGEKTRLFSGEFRNFVFIRGTEYDPQIRNMVLFEGSKNYTGSKPPHYFNGIQLSNRDVGVSESKEYVNGKVQDTGKK